ncbi:glycosyltransferase [Escherichia coli]|uniref:glycosyltransferase n=1 Tax=Escherichia coli TaxID=562 RepID=UPI003EEE8C27
MIKIAIILPSLKNVGPNRVAHTLINKLSNKEGVYLKVFYIKNELGLNFTCDTELLTLVNVRKLYAFDVLHSHMLRPDVLVGLLPFYKGLKISTIHNIVTEDIQYTHGSVISKIFSELWFRTWSRFDKIVVLSKVAKKYYLGHGLKSEKLEIIYNGIDLDIGSNINYEDKKIIEEFKGDSTLLGTLCLANHRKGIEQILYALPFLPNYKFIIIGDGPVREYLENLAISLNVRERFFILGYRENAKDLLKYIDIYLMPSKSEGFGLALLEAVAAKITVVCSNIPIFKEIFTERQVSFFELDNTNSLIQAIHNSINNDINDAYIRLKQNYSSDTMARLYHELYMTCKEVK